MHTKPKVVLRDYQLEALESVKNAIDRGIKRSAVVLATGGGKTVVFSHLIPQLTSSNDGRRQKTLVLAHKEELVYQAANTITATNPELKVEIDMRNFKASDEADVIVASVPTLIRSVRLERYNPDLFKTIILDECHHASANSWLKILNYFDALNPESPINVIGFTATLERTDGKNLGDIFQEVVFHRSLMEMVKNKELVDVKFTSIKSNIDLSEVNTRKDDYDVTSLSHAVNTDETNLLVAYSLKNLKEKYSFKSTLVFCVDISHCRTLCGVLQRSGINAQYVTGETAKPERRAIIDDFRQGKIEVLCNVQVFTEGTDIPNIDSLFLVRPTKSRPLLVQMIGRGLRLYEDKTHCHVVDIVGTRGTGFQSVPTLFSLPADHNFEGKTLQQLEKEKKLLSEEEQSLKQLEWQEKERARRQEEEAVFKSLKRLSLYEDRSMVEFDTVEGFSALDFKDEQKYSNNKNVSAAINQHTLPWVRLEYDVWGCSIDHRFLVLRREEVDGVNQFELGVNSFVPTEARVSHNFKIRKFGNETRLEKGPLEAILIRAEVHHRSMDIKRYNNFTKPITDKQSTYLYQKLRAMAKNKYDMDARKDAAIRSALQSYSTQQASKLIFAVKYSTVSLHAKWALERILGLDKNAANEAQRIRKRLQKQLAATTARAQPQPTQNSVSL